MALLARVISVPLFVDIGPGAVARLPEVLARQRISSPEAALVLVGDGVGSAVSDVLRGHIPDENIVRTRGVDVSDVALLADSVRSGRHETVVGIGGGRTVDIAKWVATRIGVPSVTVATSLAHDGIASPVSVLSYSGRKMSYGVQAPLAVLVDTEFVSRSEPRYTRSGIGDALSNRSAVEDWRLASRLHGEPIDGFAAYLAETSAQSVLHTPGSVRDPDFVDTLARSLVLGGVAMTAAGSSRPCSGACHKISHTIDELYPNNGTTHGEQVAYGTILATFLREDFDHLDALLEAAERHGLPCLPEDLGLSEEQAVRVLESAPTIRSDRFTILDAITDMSPPYCREALDSLRVYVTEGRKTTSPRLSRRLRA